MGVNNPLAPPRNFSHSFSLCLRAKFLNSRSFAMVWEGLGIAAFALVSTQLDRHLIGGHLPHQFNCNAHR